MGDLLSSSRLLRNNTWCVRAAWLGKNTVLLRMVCIYHIATSL